MNNYKPTLNNDGNVKEIFNTSDFDHEYESVKFNDLLDYANLFSSNTFLGANSFVDITFSGMLNSLSSTTLSYLNNITSDVQAQINQLIEDITTINNTITTNNDQIITELETYIDTKVNASVNSIPSITYDPISVETTISSDVNIDGILTANSSITNAGFSVYTNQILDQSFTMKLGTNNIEVGYLSLAGINKTVNVSVPISVFRTFRTNGSSLNNIAETISSVAYTINKNGQYFTNGTCTYTDTLPKTVAIQAVTTQSFSYEVYLTNANFSFTPSVTDKGAVYSIYFTINNNSVFTPLANTITETFGFYVNTTRSTSSMTLYSGSYGANYKATSYTLSNEILPTLATDSICYTNSINTKSIIIENFTLSKALFSQQMIGAYAFTADTSFYYSPPIPIICSVKNFGGDARNTISWFILFPTYKVKFYKLVNDYTADTNAFTQDNPTEAPIAISMAPNFNDVGYINLPDGYGNNTTSVRLYKKNNNSWEELTLMKIS